MKLLRNEVTGVTTQVTPQEARLITLMQRDGHVTRLSAMHAGIANITARIADLRLRASLEVTAQMRVDMDGRRYARWSLPLANHVDIVNA